MEKGRRAKADGKLKADAVRLESVELRGRVRLRSLHLASSAHAELFLAAADWLLQAQDPQGGWPVPVRSSLSLRRGVQSASTCGGQVKRSLVKGRLELAAGWHSAMAQGHGLSLLSRAFLATGEAKYREAAEAGLALFRLGPQDGGVRNRFMGTLDWYEEYPTTPGSFVLNGFLYALFGLWDLTQISHQGPPSSLFRLEFEVEPTAGEAGDLLEVGLGSLESLLAAFDSGSGSFYDLRHFALPGGAGPNRARPDYHTLHIFQLHWLALVDREPRRAALWTATADRWTQYALGHRAKHN